MSKAISPLLLGLARSRVARGVVWLDKRALIDQRFVRWRLQLMYIREARVYCHVHLAYNTNDPLSLILRFEEDLVQRTDYRVSWVASSKACGFDTHAGQRKAVYLGFFEGLGWPLGLGADCQALDYAEALDQAWLEAVSDFYEADSPRLYPRAWAPPPVASQKKHKARGLFDLLCGKN